MYRFFPAVCWSSGYPHRDEILGNIREIARNYHLIERIKWATPVESVERDTATSTDPKERGQSKWIVNGDRSTIYDGVACATGTCGKAKMLPLPGQDEFNGKIVHSSTLDDLDAADIKGKNVIVVGGGASGVEALQLAVNKGAKTSIILARSDKWIIPRNTIVDCLLACQPLGRETRFTPIIEFLLRKLHYRDLADKMSPVDVPFYASTPVVNNEAMAMIRKGQADYLRGDVQEVTPTGVRFSHRHRGVKKGGKGFEELHVPADVIVVATGFEKPTVDFLPDDLFPDGYSRPNIYLQVFPIQDTSIWLPNATFKDAVGTVGNWHIGIYARVWTVLRMDKTTRPTPLQMRTWVDLINWGKDSSVTRGLEFFTYTELVLWVVTWLLLRASRIKYAFFVLFGFGFWVHDQDALEKASKKGRADGIVARTRTFHLSLAKLAPRFYRNIQNEPARDYVQVISHFGGPLFGNVGVAERGLSGNVNIHSHPDGQKFISPPPVLGKAGKDSHRPRAKTPPDTHTPVDVGPPGGKKQRSKE